MTAPTTDFSTVVVELDSNAVFEYDKNENIEYRRDVGHDPKKKDIRSIHFKNDETDLSLLEPNDLKKKVKTAKDVLPRKYGDNKDFKSAKDKVIDLIENGTAFTYNNKGGGARRGLYGNLNTDAKPLKTLFKTSDKDIITKFLNETENKKKYGDVNKLDLTVDRLLDCLTSKNFINYKSESVKKRSLSTPLTSTEGPQVDANDLYNFLSALAKTRAILNAEFTKIIEIKDEATKTKFDIMRI